MGFAVIDGPKVQSSLIMISNRFAVWRDRRAGNPVFGRVTGDLTFIHTRLNFRMWIGEEPDRRTDQNEYERSK